MKNNMSEEEIRKLVLSIIKEPLIQANINFTQNNRKEAIKTIKNIIIKEFLEAEKAFDKEAKQKYTPEFINLKFENKKFNNWFKEKLKKQ